MIHSLCKHNLSFHMNRKRKWLNVPFLRADTHRPSPPTRFWAANSTNSSSKCSRDGLASRSQKLHPQIGRGFESRWCHKNFTRKTFFPISKTVKYRSLACLWPKLWPFWVCRTIVPRYYKIPIVWRHDGKKFGFRSGFKPVASFHLRLKSCH